MPRTTPKAQQEPLSAVVCADSSDEEHGNVVSAEESEKIEAVKAKWAPLAPRAWVLPVGTILAGCAGFVNAAAFLTGGAFVSHMTGTSTKLGMGLEGYYMDDWDTTQAWQAVLLVVSFIVGSFICGLLVSRSEVHFGKSMYGIALMLNSLMLFASMWIFTSLETPKHWPAFLTGKLLSVYLQACACGLQNGMCTAHFGAVVRTTHVTGLVTDCGLSLGRIANVFLRRRCKRRNLGMLDWTEVRIDATKLKVFTCLLTGFICGVFLGAYIQHQIGVACFAVPAAITGLGGLAYSIAKANCWHLFQQAEATQLSQDLVEVEDIFERARHQLEGVRERAASDVSHPVSRQQQAQNIEEIDAHVSHALGRLHELEASIAEVQDKVNRSISTSSMQRSRAKSHAHSEASVEVAAPTRKASSRSIPQLAAASPAVQPAVLLHAVPAAAPVAEVPMVAASPSVASPSASPSLSSATQSVGSHLMNSMVSVPASNLLVTPAATTYAVPPLQAAEPVQTALQPPQRVFVHQQPQRIFRTVAAAAGAAAPSTDAWRNLPQV
eukprot:TRINITY_DN7178_c0_g1_i2.p1 TRINITY_DN7178_c0_g1~~TRINITY_DN7178_c0_g1_i2.p1  ORF type:complete len:551 (+),score=121.16 TRINITY_DN7178_c0_g1_i2:75-1727(+)